LSHSHNGFLHSKIHKNQILLENLLNFWNDFFIKLSMFGSICSLRYVLPLSQNKCPLGLIFLSRNKCSLPHARPSMLLYYACISCLVVVLSCALQLRFVSSWPERRRHALCIYTCLILRPSLSPACNFEAQEDIVGGLNGGLCVRNLDNGNEFIDCFVRVLLLEQIGWL
jgi:hypothetical protein